MDAICQIPSTERGTPIATVTAAFAADPVERWLWPEPDLEHRILLYGSEFFWACTP
jgi:hypothetical protein